MLDKLRIVDDKQKLLAEAAERKRQLVKEIEEEKRKQETACKLIAREREIVVK